MLGHFNVQFDNQKLLPLNIPGSNSLITRRMISVNLRVAVIARQNPLMANWTSTLPFNLMTASYLEVDMEVDMVEDILAQAPAPAIQIALRSRLLHKRNYN